MEKQTKIKASPESKKARTAENKARNILKAANLAAKKAAKWPKTPKGWARFNRRHSDTILEV